MKKNNNLPEIEVVIPVAEKDIRNIPFCIYNLNKYCKNPIRKIIIVGASKLKDKLLDNYLLQWIDEETITPKLEIIESELGMLGYAHKSARWYFQQLIKFYAFRIINPSTDYILIHDADVAFVKETVFVDNEYRSLLAYGYPFHWKLNTREYNMPEKHMAISTARRLVPEWTLVDAYSGMQHHMLLERNILNELFRRVEQHHLKEFWRAFIHSIDMNRWHGISEYVIYRHFAIAEFPQKIFSRHVNGIDIMTSVTNTQCSLEQVIAGHYPEDITILACHQLTDYKRSLAASDYIPESLRENLMKHLTPLALYLDAGLLRIQPVQITFKTGETLQLFP